MNNERIRRLIESDAKSLNSLAGSDHSRKGSDTSLVSSGSGGDGVLAGQQPCPDNGPTDKEKEEDSWTRWGQIIADWDNQWKRRKDHVKEMVRQGIPHHFRRVPDVTFIYQSFLKVVLSLGIVSNAFKINKSCFMEVLLPQVSQQKLAYLMKPFNFSTEASYGSFSAEPTTPRRRSNSPNT